MHVCIPHHLQSPYYPFRTHVCIIHHLQSPYYPFRTQISVFLITSNHHTTLQDTDVCVSRHLQSPYYPFRTQISVFLITSNHHTTPSGHRCLYKSSPPITILPLQDTYVCIPNHLQLPHHPTCRRQSLTLIKHIWAGSSGNYNNCCGYTKHLSVTLSPHIITEGKLHTHSRLLFYFRGKQRH